MGIVAASGSTVVFAHGKRTFVAGLAWSMLPRSESSKRGIASAGKRIAATHGVSAQTATGRVLVGFVPPNAPGKAKSADSAAMALALAVDRPTLFVRQVDDTRWWYVLVHPGEVDISTDLVGTGEEVGRALDDLLGDAMRNVDWASFRVVVSGELPPSHLLAGAGASVGTFASLLEHAPRDKRAAVHRLVGGVSLPLLAFGVLAVGLLAMGIVLYVAKVVRDRRELAAAQAMAAAQQRQAAELDSLVQKRIDDAVLGALRQDTATVAPASFVQVCTDTFSRMPRSAGGWSMQRVECRAGGTSASSNWRRMKGSLADNVSLVHAANELGASTPTFDIKGQDASLSVRVDKLPPRAGMLPEKLPEASAVWLDLGTALQQLEVVARANVTISPPVRKALQFVDPRIAGGKNNGLSPVPESKLYQSGTLSIAGRGIASLQQLLGVLDLPYVTLSTIRVQVATSGEDWKVEGMYVVR